MAEDWSYEAAEAACRRSMRRLRRLEVSDDFMLAVFRGQMTPGIVVGGILPRDAHIVAAEFDADRHTVILTIRSAWFDVVSEGVPVPDAPTVEYLNL